MTQPRFQRFAAMVDAALVLLLLLLPFEATQGVELPGLVLTNLEVLTLAVLAGWGLQLGLERRWPRVPGWFGWSVAGFLAILLLSAALAQSYRGVALKFSLRQVQGGLLALCLAERVGRGGWRIGRYLLAALALGGVISAGLGLWELGQGSLASTLLSPFRKTTTLMGGILRLSASFHHANIAAMYFESLLPLLLVASLALLPGRWRWAGLLGSALLWAAILLTYSRASVFAALVLVAGVPGVIAWRWRRSPQTWRSLALSGSLLGGMGLLLLLNAPLRLRLSATELDSWYSVSYRPGPIAPMAPGELRRIPIGLTNTGQAPWLHDGQRPMKLAYHWLNPATGVVVDFEGQRTEMPHAVAPGESVELMALVRAPGKVGNYLLAWDMVGEEVSWFSQLGAKVAQVPVAVSGPPVNVALPAPAPARAPSPSGKLEVSPSVPSRRSLWGAAISMWSQRPVLGIGPAVFQHTYGPAIGQQQADPRYHTHNLLLEILTGSGVCGLLALLALSGQLGYRGGKALLQARAAPSTAPGWWWLLASLGGWVAFLIHGMLDMFLAFTPTYLLLWIWMGMIAGLTAGQETRRVA